MNRFSNAYRADEVPQAKSGLSSKSRKVDKLAYQARGGDPAALRALIEVITPLVVRYCKARLAHRRLTYFSAEDVAQEVCLAALIALPTYEDRGGSFLYLVYAIASNKVTDAVRASARNRTDPTPVVPEFPDSTRQPESSALATELGNHLAELLSTLPKLQREIIILRVINGLSAHETAEVLGRTAGNIRVLQHRALARLRDLAIREPEMW